MRIALEYDSFSTLQPLHINTVVQSTRYEWSTVKVEVYGDSFINFFAKGS